MISFRSLLPPGGEIDAQALVASLELASPHVTERPYTVVNFVASADGRAQFDGRSAALGDDGDRALFHALRERVDAVMAGTGTLAAENYGRILGQADRRERRIAAGRTPEPLACTVTRSGRLPLEIPLFADPDARVVVFSPSAPPTTELQATVDWEPLDLSAARPLAEAMGTLRARCGIETLLCEGGPTLFGVLLAEGLVDELFLTLAPKLTGGGDALTITRGPQLPAPAPLALRSVLERDGTLFLRYAVSS